MLALVALSLLAEAGAASISLRFMQPVADVDLGATQPLTEAGYQRVAASKNDEVMKTFAKRVLADSGRVSLDEGALSGFVPHYSGTIAVQSLQRMTEELSRAIWTANSEAAKNESTPEESRPKDSSTSNSFRLLHNASEPKAPAIKESTEAQSPKANATTSKGHSSNTEAEEQTQASEKHEEVASKTVAGALAKVAQRSPEAITSKVAESKAKQQNGEDDQKSGSWLNRMWKSLTNEKAEVETVPKVKDVIESVVESVPKVKNVIEIVAKDVQEKATNKVQFAGESPAGQPRLVNVKLTAPAQTQHKSSDSSAKVDVAKHDPVAKAPTLSRLPGVEDVLAKAKGTLANLTSQAEMMRKRVAQAHAHLKRQAEDARTRYQAKIAKQKADNDEVQAGNEALKKLMLAIKAGNDKLRGEAEGLQKGNEMLRSELMSLATRAGLSIEFVSASINTTDDTNASDLQVLIPSTPKPDLDYFLARERERMTPDSSKEVGAGRSVLFMQVPLEEEAHKPDMIEVIQASLANVHDAESEGLEKLKQDFEALIKQEEDRREALDKVREELEARRASLLEVKERLRIAKAHLLATHKSLRRRLQAFAAFSRSMDKALNASLTHARKELDA